MRVALVSMLTSHYEDTPSARRLERIAGHLAEDGHDVTVFCAQWWDGHEDVRTANGVTYRRVTLGPAPRAFSYRLPFSLARHRPDVIHARPTPPQTVVAASVGGTLSRSPLLVEWYGDEALPPGSRWTRWAAREPAMVVTPSEMVRTDVRELGASGDTTRVIPESIDYEHIEAVEPDEAVEVTFAHHLDASANLDSLLLGLAELRTKDWQARIIGDGPERADYEEQVADLRIDDRVEFLGDCGRDERIATYRGAHAFVQTASREFFATELLWALACGCIGIVEYQAESSAHELIEGYERSYRVTSSQGIADAIAEAGEFERRSIEPEWGDYDHRAIRGQYIGLYRDLIEDYGFL
jgi:glycosyltransferase involved in cell wall biosynthesis